MKEDIPMNHWVIPWDIWNVMEADKEAAKQGRMMKKKEQQILDFETVTGPREFTRAGVLHAVANLIATNNQVSSQYSHQHQRTHIEQTCLQPLVLADNLAFRNSLVVMRPKSTTADLPTSYDAKVYIHNQLVQHMKVLKEEIAVSNFSSSCKMYLLLI